jgi:predicted nucleic acid-binding protein
LKAISDTGFIVAFLNRNDQHHSWATAIAAHITEPLLTCEAVLAEAVFQLSSASIVFRLLNDGLLRLSFSLQDNLGQVQDLAIRYRDRQPDLADLCVVRMSELYPRHTVLTVDDDFRIYRRNKRETIPLIFPAR